VRPKKAEAIVADLLRRAFGPLLFRVERPDPGRSTPLMRSLAEAAYEDRVVADPSRPGCLVFDPARLLVLADSLEEAGIDDYEILDHLRGPGEHVRVCWCLDLVLRKE
jgi:hypothetical protein